MVNPATVEVADPVGLALAELTPPDTGIAPVSTTSKQAILFSAIALTAGLLLRPVQRVASWASRD